MPQVALTPPPPARAGLLVRLKAYTWLHAATVLFACASILAKFAGRYAILSWPFLGYLLAEVAVLAVYALIWQQILKRVPATSAYAHRALAIVWTFVAGLLVFHESFHWGHLAAIACILCGIILVVTDDE